MPANAPGLSDALRQRLYTRLNQTAPRTAARAAFRHFCTPPRRGPGALAEARLIEKMANLFATASHNTVQQGRTRVQCYVWHTDVAKRGRVLLLHGWTGRAEIMGLFVAPLLRAGFDVVALDLPAHGRSGGQRLNLPIGKRAVLAVDQALGPFTSAISHSFGGPILAAALDGGPPIPRALKLDRAVLIASPNRLTAMIDAFRRRFALPSSLADALVHRVEREAARPVGEVDVEKFLPPSQIPALLIHARNDEDVPFERALSILARSPQAHLLAFDGLGHRHIIISSAVVRAAVAYLCGTLPEAAVSAQTDLETASVTPHPTTA